MPCDRYSNVFPGVSLAPVPIESSAEHGDGAPIPGTGAGRVMELPQDSISAGQRGGWLTSLGFWLCLFAAAALYAVVTLSPKALAYATLNREYVANQWRLVSLERQVARLERVIDAEKNDPAFVREQARSDLGIAAPEEQRIPVDSHLHLNIGAGRPELVVAPGELPWYAPLLAIVAGSRSASNACLGGAAVLVLYAFTLLRDSDPESRRLPADLPQV